MIIKIRAIRKFISKENKIYALQSLKILENTKYQSNVFQMAWACKEEEAMDIIGKHMGIMRLEKKKELSEIYSKLIFLRHGQNWTDVKWTTHWGVTFVTMWD